MTFLPQFLNWQAAAIAAGVAIPSLLLLYFLKLRRVPQPVGSTLLWKKAIQDLQVNSPFQRLRRNLLLLLQLLVLLALLLALARPVSEGQPVAGEKTVILIDRSASMNATDGEGGTTRLEEAKNRARALIGTMGRGDQAMIISFDGSAQVIQPFSADAALLRSAINDITPSDRPTSLATAYTLTNANMSYDFDRLREDEAQAASVFLFSDGRVPPADVADLSLRGNLTYERVGTNNAANLGIVAASVKRNYEQPTQAQVFARASNFGPDVARAAVRVSVAEFDAEDPSQPLNFEPLGTLPVEVTLPPERWTDEQWREITALTDAAAVDMAEQELANVQRRDSIDVTLELPRAAVVRIELVQIDNPRQVIDDALAADNTAFIVVPPPEPLSAVLVTRGNYFLELLIGTQPLDEPLIVPPAEYERMVEAGEATEFDVTIFDNYSPPTVPPSGTFVYSGGLPPEEATDLRPVTNEAGVGIFYENNSVLDWEREHPMLRGLLLNRVWAAEGRLLSLPLGAQMLIEGDKGPMLVLERKGPRTNLIFSFDLMQSTWPRQKTFPYFAYQMFQYLAVGEDVRVRESIRPGEVIGVPRSILDRANLAGELTVVGPTGTADTQESRRTIRVDEGGSTTLGPFEKVGVYRTIPSLPQFERVAVSLLDANESNLLPAYTDPGNLSGLNPVEAATQSSGGTRNIEWWWWLVAVAAGGLLVEWFVYTRRVAA